MKPAARYSDRATNLRRRRRPRAFAWVVVAVCLAAGLNWVAGAQEAAPRFDGLTLTFYWGVNCSHCRTAEPFVDSLPEEYPGLRIERVEVQKDTAGQQRFLEHMKAAGGPSVGIPTFVIGQERLIGFTPGYTEDAVRQAIERAAGRTSAVDVRSVTLPLFGVVDSTSVSLPHFTVLVGLADGLNPCAFWVLTVMLSLLLHVRSRTRLLLFGGLFVLISGLVYFLFMAAWAVMFALLGVSRLLTQMFGIALLVMGLINLKELFWFKRGLSLMIPDSAKAGLYARMRAITGTASLPAAAAGIAALSFIVNLVELGCTLGLPAVYTRILTLQPDLGTAGRYAYLALYNLAYMVPLASVVVLYAFTLHRLTLSERGAKALKTLSGILLAAFGILFLLWPGTLA